MDPTDGRYPALKYRDFRLLWMGQFVSNAGTQMQIVALNWHIYVLTDSAVALGLIGLARFIPIVIFSLIGGSVADAHNRKKLMIVTQTIMTILSGILAFMTLTNTATPTIIYIITALLAGAVAFDAPARQALFPSLVERKHLANAASLNVIMFQTGMIVGPALAGFLIASIGVGNIYLLNTLSFLAVIAALLAMKHTGEITGEKTQISLTSIVEGLAFVRSKTMIWSTMILDFFSTFFASATVLLPIFAKDVLNVGPQGLGILYSAPSIGAVIAGTLMAHFGHTYLRHQGKVLLAAVSVFGFATILFGVSTSFFVSLIALFILGAGDSISTIIRNTIRQLETPDNIRGRMTGINMIFFMGGPQLGEFEAGLVAAAVGGPVSVVLGGIGTLIVVGVMSIGIPQLRRYKGHEQKEFL